MIVGHLSMRDRTGETALVPVYFEETGTYRAGVPSMRYVARWEAHQISGASMIDAGHQLARALGWPSQVFPVDGFPPAARLSLGDALWLRLSEAPPRRLSPVLDLLFALLPEDERERFRLAFQALDGRKR